MRRRSPLRRLLFLIGPGLLPVLAGCSTLVLGIVGPPVDLDAHVLRPASRFNENAIRDPGTGMLVGDTGYALYLLAFPVGMSFSDSNAFLQTLHKHPKTGWKDHNVGHGWIIVESPEQTIECGHTGEDGIERPAYYQGVFEKIRARDPNPIAYLWEEFDDGRFVNGSNGHVPAFVAKLPITAAEHARLIEYINSYDYKHFSLVRKHCTEFVAGAAEIMGVNLVTKVRLKIPREVHFRGKRYTLWTDARYEYLTFGSPDVLDSDLRQLVKEGIAEDAAAWYSK